MNENNMVIENASLFLDLDPAVSQLADIMSHYESNEFLMVVLCEDAMPVANEIARMLELNLIFSAVDLNVKPTDSFKKDIPIDFDYGIVKGSGRDIPQDFIFHQEQNLRSTLIAVYKETYESITKAYPDKLIILVDQLINSDASFFPCVIHKDAKYSGGNAFSNPVIRQFVFIHASLRTSGDMRTQGFDIIVKQSTVELV
jgi:hypothetical protein